MKLILPIIVLSTVIGAPLFAFGEGWFKVAGAVCFVVWMVASAAALIVSLLGKR